MKTKAPLSGISAAQVDYYARGWLLDCEIRQMSGRTISSRRDVVMKFAWFLRREEMECDSHSVRAFLLYLTRAHQDPAGRWGNPAQRSPVKPGTVVSYFNILRTFFASLVESEDIETSPMARLKAPVDRPDQITPFTAEQVERLEKEAKDAMTPKRDSAVILLLLDTGIRASELAGLRATDIDLAGRTVSVEGKGGKRRNVPFGKRAVKALWAYQRDCPREGSQPFFFAERGHTPGAFLTRSGVGQIIRRLGRRAGLETARCSPHTFRHTFAIEFLRNGGDQFTLMQMLGHTDLTMTSRYLKIAQADVERQHRAFSPADRMKKR